MLIAWFTGFSLAIVLILWICNVCGWDDVEKRGRDRKMRGWKIFSFLLYVLGWKDEKVER